MQLPVVLVAASTNRVEWLTSAKARDQGLSLQAFGLIELETFVVRRSLAKMKRSLRSNTSNSVFILRQTPM